MRSLGINNGGKIIIFLLNPFISAVTSLWNIRDGFSHKLLYCWFIIFGIGFCAVDESADSFRYVEDFYRESNYTWNQYVNEINYWLTFEGDTKDVYTLTVNFLVGRFSNNYHWTYLIYAVVFGFFYIKSLKIFLKYTTKNDLVFYILLFLFCYSNPISNINGVRFYTSAWIGTYVGLQLFVENNKKCLPLLILMPIIHGSSVIWAFLLAIAWFSRYFQNLWIVLFVLSSFVSAISYLPLMNGFSDMLPQFMQNQIWAYTESEMALERMEGHSYYGAAYAQFLIALPGYFSLLMSYLLIFNRKKINITTSRKTLFTIFISLAATTNFLSSIPSVGRFRTMVIPFMIIVWMQNREALKKLDWVIKIIPFIYAYSLLQWFRLMVSVTEMSLYILPAPITAFKYLI